MRCATKCLIAATCVARRLFRPAFFAALCAAGFLIDVPSRAAELVIWDDRPAEQWDTAYPVGNGRLGAMPFGQFPQEMILINEETIWARSSDDKFVMAGDSNQAPGRSPAIGIGGRLSRSGSTFRETPAKR